jgi:peptidoglycan/xylan/chitin deacetylase (PgdA/CDA1 family)
VTPTNDPPDRSRQERYRSILAVCTLLMMASMLLSACLPLGRLPEPTSSSPVLNVNPVQHIPPTTGDHDYSPLPTTDLPKPADLPVLPEGEPSQLVVHGNRDCEMIALTYDAGASADAAVAILDVLKKHSVVSTFFLTGRWVENFPDFANRIAAEGHEIANHTYSHRDLTTLPDDEVLMDIAKGEEAIRAVTSAETRPLFREPYGAFNDVERHLVRQAGYSYSIYWDNDTLDWQFPGADLIYERIVDRAKNGSIVLMHLGVPDSAIASDRAIPVLRQQGYSLVTITELLTCTP